MGSYILSLLFTGVGKSY